MCDAALPNPSAIQRFNTSCLVQPGPGVVGNTGRNILSQGAEYHWDFSLFKNVQFTESKSLQISGEFFNLFSLAIAL